MIIAMATRAAIGQTSQVVAECFAPAALGDVALVAHVAQDQAIGRALFAGQARGAIGGFAVGFGQGRNHHAAPECAAVGAQQAALVQRPAVSVGFAQAVQRALGRDRIGRIKHRVALALGVGAEAGHAADARVPFAQPALRIQAGQCVIGDAGQDRIEPGVVLPLAAFAPHLLGDVVDDRHDAAGIEPEQRDRQDLRHALAAAAAGMQVHVHAVADLAALDCTLLAQVAQVGRDVLERDKQVVQPAIARMRHQKLGRDRVDHGDLAIGGELYQPNRGEIQELDQRLVFRAELGEVVTHFGCRLTRT
jgi:hypothetical protein